MTSKAMKSSLEPQCCGSNHPEVWSHRSLPVLSYNVEVLFLGVGDNCKDEFPILLPDKDSLYLQYAGFGWVA
jgi:hypothetical protein